MNNKESNIRISFSLSFKVVITILVFILIFILAMRFGASETSLKDVWQALFTQGTNDKVIMLREIRIPRAVAAILVGAALAVSGAIMQGITRNPLADPGLLGLTAGANLALALTIAFIPQASYFMIMIACFIGAFVGTLLVLSLGAMIRGGFTPFKIVLAGAAVTAFLSAISEGIGLYFKISKQVSMWTAGGLVGTNWKQLQVIAPFILIGIVIALILSKQLTILSLNEEVAVGLGQKTTQIKLILFIVIVILAGAAVALVGNIAFLGLMVPHLVRAVIGRDYRYVLPFSVLFGGGFMLLADLIARTINAPYEAPVASIISIIGLIFFLYIMRKGVKYL
jgi:iron complex transport system permease protein